jgi:uncharacterized membrane protein
MREGMKMTNMTTDEAQFNKINVLIRAIIGLSSMMLLLLISIPFLLQTTTTLDVMAYVLYLLFIISISLTLGIAIAWLVLMKPTLGEEVSTGNTDDEKDELNVFMNSDSQEIVEYLRLNNGEVWQSQLTKALGWTASKVSRTLMKLEYDEIVERTRDGMGKKIRLISNPR